MPNPFFSCRIPQELSERINQHCVETGESKTQVLLNALSQYLDFPIKPPATIAISTERFSQLEQRVAELETKLDARNVSGFVDSTEIIQQLNEALIDEHCDQGDYPNTNAIVENKSQGETSVHCAGRIQLKLF